MSRRFTDRLGNNDTLKQLRETKRELQQVEGANRAAISLSYLIHHDQHESAYEQLPDMLLSFVLQMKEANLEKLKKDLDEYSEENFSSNKFKTYQEWKERVQKLIDATQASVNKVGELLSYRMQDSETGELRTSYPRLQTKKQNRF